MRIKELEYALLVMNEDQRKATVGGISWEEAEAMMNNGTWTGGYVDGEGYMGPEFVIYGTYNSDSNSNSNSYSYLDININPWVSAAALDLWGIYDPVGANIWSAAQLAQTIYDYNEGNISKSTFETQLLLGLMAFAPGGNTAGTAASQFAQLCGQINIYLTRYFSPSNTQLYFWGITGF